MLARRAAGDLGAAQKLAPDPEIDFPKTHDLEFLVNLAKRHDIAVPAEVTASFWLTPWAAEFRYDDVPLEALDRGLAVELAEGAVGWSSKLIIA